MSFSDCKNYRLPKILSATTPSWGLLRRIYDLYRRQFTVDYISHYQKQYKYRIIPKTAILTGDFIAVIATSSRDKVRQRKLHEQTVTRSNRDRRGGTHNRRHQRNSLTYDYDPSLQNGRH
jgi:hypothetical protein